MLWNSCHSSAKIVETNSNFDDSEHCNSTSVLLLPAAGGFILLLCILYFDEEPICCYFSISTCQVSELNMSCIKLSIGTRLLLLVVAMVLACGFVPLFLIYHGSPGDADLIALSNQVEKLEREHKELKDFMAKLELKGKERPSSINEMLGPSPSSPSSPSHNSSKPPNTAEQFVSETGHDAPSFVEFPEPITYNTPTSQSSESVLVVGGTGGQLISFSTADQYSYDVKINIYTSCRESFSLF
jgi:hypothetical protein